MRRKTLVHITVIITLAVMLFSSVHGGGYSSDNAFLQKTAGTAGARQAIDFKLNDLDGKSVSLSDFKGKKIYLNFWASWCSWCVKELPDIEELYKEKIPGLVILTIAINETRESARFFISNKKYNFPVLIDTEGAIADTYGVEGIPCSVFINKDFKISRQVDGMLNKFEMKQYLEEMNDKNVTPVPKPTATPKPIFKPTPRPAYTPTPKPSPYSRQIAVKVNGNDVKLPYAPVIKEKTLLVPAEPMVRSLGASYKWDTKRVSITISKGELSIILKIGSKKVKVNGKEESISYPPQNYKTPFIPLKYVAEKLGFTYLYDEKSNTVLLKGK